MERKSRGAGRTVSAGREEWTRWLAGESFSWVPVPNYHPDRASGPRLPGPSAASEMPRIQARCWWRGSSGAGEWHEGFNSRANCCGSPVTPGGLPAGLAQNSLNVGFPRGARVWVRIACPGRVPVCARTCVLCVCVCPRGRARAPPGCYYKRPAFLFVCLPLRRRVSGHTHARTVV